ncbi:MAG TPA: precorrin-6A synthase (deacetylating) [Chloroflexota bacterium]|nr:precorrin-6A synthase (deacetylating) [Chloroflexota bacterium]
MRKLFIIGIGAGDPEYMTIQAIKALNQVDVIFVVDKGREKQALARLRTEVCERFIDEETYRVVPIADPERDRTASAYGAAVDDWRRRRAEAYEAAILAELADDERGAFLVWGDPAIYDSTLAIVEEVLARGAVTLEYEVIPGISSIQALAARHKVALNRVGEPIQITTGRRLKETRSEDVENVVVMLDADNAYRGVASEEIDIYWGAYVGTEDEILISGALPEVEVQIEQVRHEARQRIGWIMDTYLLRRRRR